MNASPIVTKDLVRYSPKTQRATVEVGTGQNMILSLALVASTAWGTDQANALAELLGQDPVAFSTPETSVSERETLPTLSADAVAEILAFAESLRVLESTRFEFGEPQVVRMAEAWTFPTPVINHE